MDAVAINEDGNEMYVMFHENRVVFAGAGEFDSNSPIFIITANANNDLTVKNIRYNDIEKEDVRLVVSSMNDNNEIMDKTHLIHFLMAQCSTFI